MNFIIVESSEGMLRDITTSEGLSIDSVITLDYDEFDPGYDAITDADQVYWNIETALGELRQLPPGKLRREFRQRITEAWHERDLRVKDGRVIK